MAARASGVDVYHGNTLPPGQDFVILKATEGTTYVDPTFGARFKALHGHGPHVGAYHFAHPEAHSAQAEVDHFASVVGASVAADVSLWLDLEAGLDQLGATALRHWKNDWITAARRVWPNNRIGLYVNRSYWAAVKPGAGDGLWIATPGTAGSVGIADPWLIHQYSEAGGVDRDVFNGTVADLAAWAGAGGDDMPTADEIAAAVVGRMLAAPPYPAGEFGRAQYSLGDFITNANAKGAQARNKAQECADAIVNLSAQLAALHPNVDVQALAADLAALLIPALDQHLPTISDADLTHIAQAVNDELARRQQS